MNVQMHDTIHVGMIEDINNWDDTWQNLMGYLKSVVVTFIKASIQNNILQWEGEWDVFYEYQGKILV